MNDFLNQMVKAELTGGSIPQPEDQHLKPIYFNSENQLDPEPFYAELIDLSRQIWTYRGYTGLMRPWHDQDPYRLLRFRKESFRSFFHLMEEEGINWKSYLTLLFLTTAYELWERPTLLVFQNSRLSWFRKLRAAAGSREAFDTVATFMMEFVNLQVQGKRDLGLPLNGFVATDQVPRGAKGSPTKYLVLYHRVLDKVSALKGLGVEPAEWLQVKYTRCAEFLNRKDPGATVLISMILNTNGFDPDLESIKAMQRDPWRDLRRFLGLSTGCQFKDNCLPKGWRPSSEDADDASKIVCITADGYYYREDGTQRRGRRHYAQNKYLNICCVPSNFQFFQKQWDDPRLLSAEPTWEEYSKWGLYLGLWNEGGTNISKYTGLKDIHWRKP